MPDDPDRQLLDRFVRGDQEAFEALFRLFERDVYGWVLRIVRDPAAAEDATVDAFWRAYRGRARFDASRSVGAWLRRIATNAALDQLRSDRREGAESGLSVPQAAGGSGHDSVSPSVRIAFRRLSPKLRAVVALALIEERPYDEIADALDVPVGTVKSRVFRAIRALKDELARLGVRL